MSDADHPDWFTLSAYFVGDCTLEERTSVERWIAAAPERPRLVLQLRALWHARQQPPRRDYDRDTAVAHVMAAVREQCSAVPRHGAPSRTLPQVVRSLVDGMAGRTMAALFGPHDTTLSEAEVEQLRKLIDRTETESE